MKTIIEFFEPPIVRLCLMIFIGMAALAGYNWICWSAIEGGTWAAWIQAVGSIAAILGSLAIATRQSREQASHTRVAELEVAHRAATFGNLAAQRVLAAVNNLMKVLNEWPKGKPFAYNPQFLISAEKLVVMALERDLQTDQAKMLVSLHNDLINILQGVSEIQGVHEPMGYQSVEKQVNALHAKIQDATVDAHFIEKAVADDLQSARAAHSHFVR